MFEGYPDVMIPEEARHALKIGRNTMYQLLKTGKIKYLTIGRKIKIPKRYLIDYIESECDNNRTVAGSPSCH